MTIKLIRYDAACKAIAACVRVDEAKAIRDEALRLQAYARQAKNKQMEADCLEVKMVATRRLHELIEAQKTLMGLSKGGRPSKKTGFSKNPVSLRDAGIDKNIAHQARTLGRLTPQQFAKAVADARESATQVARRAMRIINLDSARSDYDKRKEQGGTYRDLKQMIRDGKKFSVIYVDPPWSYETYSGKGKERSADRHYDTMPLDEIKAMPIDKLAAKDCCLMLWATWPHMANALEVIKCWGFQYKTAAFDWVKTNNGIATVRTNGKGLHFGMGHWTRANTEPCLLATIGSPLRMHADVHQVILHSAMRHSEKPEEARIRIERLLRGPYLELFGRKLVPGWTVWGNEVPFADNFKEAAE